MLLSGILLHTEATHRGHFGSVIRRYSCIWLVICAVNYMSLTSLGPWMHQSGCLFAFRSLSLWLCSHLSVSQCCSRCCLCLNVSLCDCVLNVSLCDCVSLWLLVCLSMFLCQPFLFLNVVSASVSLTRLQVSPNVALDVACVSMSLSVIVFSMSLSVIVYLSGCLCVSQCFSVSRFCFSMFLCQPVWSYSY